MHLEMCMNLTCRNPGLHDGQIPLVIVNKQHGNFQHTFLSLYGPLTLTPMLFLFCLQAEFECINSKKKQKKKGYKNSGVVSVKLCQVWYHVFLYVERVQHTIF